MRGNHIAIPPAGDFFNRPLDELGGLPFSASGGALPFHSPGRL
jgi:hypothetical protein